MPITEEKFVFNPLATLGAVIDDPALTSNQKLILVTIIRRTNNTTGEVWGGQVLIAQLSGLSLSTIKRFYRSDLFAQRFIVQPRDRHKRLFWSGVTETPLGVTQTPDRGHSDPLSTYLSTTTSTKSYKQIDADMKAESERLFEETKQKLEELNRTWEQ